MLMLYLISAEIFDLCLKYSYSSECVVIAGPQEDRKELACQQFGGHNRSEVKRAVLLGARALTSNEVRLLYTYAGTDYPLWLVTKVVSMPSVLFARSLPRLVDEEEMHEVIEGSPDRYYPVPLVDDQYIHSVWFSKLGSGTASPRVAA